MPDRGRGRPRDEGIDARVIEATRHHLARHGYEAMSLAAIADDADTTRAAIYRRWPTKADLATAAIAAMSRADERAETDDPYADLLGELGAFRTGVSRPDGLSMVGTMLIASTDPELVRLYRERVVQPRRARIRSILERARAQGAFADDADVDMAVNLFTGSWYAIALAGDRFPRDWPRRIATLAWRALGGVPPDTASTRRQPGR